MLYFDDLVRDNRDAIFHDELVSKELESLLDEARKYNIYNLIQRIACLNLFHQNQNKSIIFDTVIDAILQHNKKEYKSGYNISPGKFRKLLNGIMETPLAYAIDPPENLFVENVMFYGNYKVFNGIDHHPTYNLQMIIRTIFERSNDYPEEFKTQVFRLVYLILKESNQIVDSLENIENNHEEDEAKSLYIPTASIMERYVALVAIEGSKVRDALGNDYELLKMIVTDFGKSWVSDIDNRCFYSAPILYDDQLDKYIFLNVGLLPTALFYWISCLAEKYEIQQQVISDFNNCVFYHCRTYLKRLGHMKIMESQFEIVLVNEDYYKELITSVHNNQFLVMLYLCDDGSEYRAETMHSAVSSDKYEIYVNNRIEAIISKLTEYGIDSGDVYFILVLNSIGREFHCDIRNNKLAHALLLLYPKELMCISINEEKQASFLPRYIEAKSLFAGWNSGILSELNTIELYTAQDYSFYLGDDINPTETNVYVAPGDSIDYIKRALIKEDRKMVESYDNSRYVEVVLNDARRKIYVDTNSLNEIRLAYYLDFTWFSLWVITDRTRGYKAIEIYHSLADTITYWIAECRKDIELIKGKGNEKIIVCISLSDDIQEYFYDKDGSYNLADCLEIISENDVIHLMCSADVLRYLNYIDNSHEKEFIRIVLSIILKKLHVNNPDTSFMNEVFSNPIKKKIFSLKYSSLPYLKPKYDRSFHYVHKEDEDQLLNWIGDKILSEENWKIGVVQDSDRTVVANKVVDILYNRLQEEVAKLNPYHLVELIYDDLEKVIFNVMLSNHRYASDVACYPEKEKQILDEINKTNQASIALKFLMEYVAAQPPSGDRIIGEGDYERLIAICSLIVDWAYKNDLFYYHVVNTPIEFLKSRRIGMKQIAFQKITKVNEKNRRSQLEWSSTIELRECYDIPHASYIEQVDDAFKDEFGYSLEELQLFVVGMREYSKKLPGDTVYVKTLLEVKKYLEQFSERLSMDAIEEIIKSISLRSREDFLKPPKKYKKEDVYPWRFNREYSFIRRPIIIRGNDILWGNRQLSHTLSYTMSLIYGGRLKARKPKMQQLMGKIADNNGKDFNNLIYEMIKQMNEFEVDKNVSKVNKKLIADQIGNLLGDIDVLIIDHKCGTIICAEVKDFHFSRNPYEVHLEYLKMFEAGKGYYFKHQRRVQWCSEHISDLVVQYNLEERKWKVVGTFIVSEPLGSNEIYDKEISVITEAELTIDTIRDIK